MSNNALLFCFKWIAVRRITIIIVACHKLVVLVYFTTY